VDDIAGVDGGNARAEPPARASAGAAARAAVAGVVGGNAQAEPPIRGLPNQSGPLPQDPAARDAVDAVDDIAGVVDVGAGSDRSSVAEAMIGLATSRKPSSFSEMGRLSSSQVSARTGADVGPKVTTAIMSAVLRRQGQHTSGPKAELMMRVADGERNGRLGCCPADGCSGRLRVNPNDPDTVLCPGTFDKQVRRTTRCPGRYVRFATNPQVPRNTWTEPLRYFTGQCSMVQDRVDRRLRTELLINTRQRNQAQKMRQMHDANSSVATGKYVNVRLAGKRRFRTQRSVEGVVYFVHPNSNGCRVVTSFGILRKGTGRVPETFSQENLEVKPDDAPVSTSLMVLRQRALRGEINEKDRKQKYLGLREAARLIDERQVAEARSNQAARNQLGR